MRTSTTLAMLATMLTCLAGAVAGFAEEARPPCLDDAKRFCGNVPPTGSFVQDCLQARQNELSPACRKQVATLTRDAEALAEACRTDLAGVCADQRLATGARATCLLAHRDQLSERCRTSLDEQSHAE